MEKIDIDAVTHRYYVKDAKLGFDEDDLHEFKGHLSFTKNQISPFCQDQRSRQPISK